MPIDYSTIPGLTPEQITELTALHDNDVSSLISNRDSIKQEKLGVQERLTLAEQVAEDARSAAAAAKEEALKAAGDMTGLKALYEEQLATTTAEYAAATKTAKDALTQRDRGDTLGKAMGIIHDDHKWNSKDMLSNMLKDGYNDQGKYAPKFEYEGEVVANSIEELNSWASEQETFKRILKGVDSSGAGTTQSQGGSAANDKDAEYQQRLRAAGLTN